MPHWRPLSVVLLSPLVPLALLPAMTKPESVMVSDADVVAVKLGVEVKQVAVFFGQSAVPVIPNASGDAQGWSHLELILQEEACLIGAIVAIGVALQESGRSKVLRRVRRDPVVREGDKIGRGDVARTRAMITNIQLRIGPAAAEGKRVLAFAEDACGGGHDAVLEDAGIGRLVFGIRADGKGRRCASKNRPGIGVIRIAHGIVDRDSGKIISKCRAHTHLLRSERLIVGGISFFAQYTHRFRDAQGRAECLHVVD